jgi:predicted MPP superfamily phosphohydrolase
MSAVVVLAFAVGALVLVLGYGWVEAGWLRTRVVAVTIAGLPEALEGVRISHLSDFHLGARLSRGNRASVLAAAWVAERQPDVVCVTGDLVSHPRGEPLLRRLLAELDRPVVVLGNHDVAVTRDPFSRAAELRDLTEAVLLRDVAETVMVRGESVQFVGVDPGSYRDKLAQPELLANAGSSLRVLLCHFPGIVDRIPPATFDLILAGHLHAGQICLPWGRHRVTLAHPRARFVAGLYETEAGTMHVSPGTGTTFVPFRFFARPEATELVLRRGG